MFERFKRAIGNWQDLAIWLPIAIGLLLAATYLLPRADPMAAVDGLGFLQGYAALMLKGVLITFAAWMCKRTYTRDLGETEENRLFAHGDWRMTAIDRLEWAMWLILWYVILSN